MPPVLRPPVKDAGKPIGEIVVVIRRINRAPSEGQLSTITKMAGSGRRNRRGNTLIFQRKTGSPTLDQRKKMHIAPTLRVKENVYPMTPSKWNKERVQPAATDHEETSTHTAARCNVDAFLTPMSIAKYFREN